VNQDRINKQLIRYDHMEAKLDEVRHQLTPLEALYVERMIEYRREQLTLLAQASRSNNSATVVLAARIGAAATAYEQTLSREVQDAIDQSH
jgi:hypothetical protein